VRVANAVGYELHAAGAEHGELVGLLLGLQGEKAGSNRHIYVTKQLEMQLNVSCMQQLISTKTRK
jgi:hypothetical protein